MHVYLFTKGKFVTQIGKDPRSNLNCKSDVRVTLLLLVMTKQRLRQQRLWRLSDSKE